MGREMEWVTSWQKLIIEPQSAPGTEKKKETPGRCRLDEELAMKVEETELKRGKKH